MKLLVPSTPIVQTVHYLGHPSASGAHPGHWQQAFVKGPCLVDCQPHVLALLGNGQTLHKKQQFRVCQLTKSAATSVKLPYKNIEN